MVQRRPSFKKCACRSSKDPPPHELSEPIPTNTSASDMCVILPFLKRLRITLHNRLELLTHLDAQQAAFTCRFRAQRVEIQTLRLRLKRHIEDIYSNTDPLSSSDTHPPISATSSSQFGS